MCVCVCTYVCVSMSMCVCAHIRSMHGTMATCQWHSLSNVVVLVWSCCPSKMPGNSSHQVRFKGEDVSTIMCTNIYTPYTLVQCCLLVLYLYSTTHCCCHLYRTAYWCCHLYSTTHWCCHLYSTTHWCCHLYSTTHWCCHLYSTTHWCCHLYSTTHWCCHLYSTTHWCCHLYSTTHWCCHLYSTTHWCCHLYSTTHWCYNKSALLSLMYTIADEREVEYFWSGLPQAPGRDPQKHTSHCVQMYL